MLKVSIVTISFNQASYLERTIESVLNQDYGNIEYIVVDPGSKDGSRELIKRNESRISKVIFEPDDGPADGLNKGFAAATGDIFAFLNSDDILYPGAVSGAVRYFAAHADVDVVSGHARIIDPDDQVLRRAYSDRMSPIKFVYLGAILIQPSTFFRRRAFERTPGFNSKNHVSWDGELFFEMALAGCKFDLSEEIWSGFRLHERSITVSKKLEEKGREKMNELLRRVTGRGRNNWDNGWEVAYRAWRHLRNPRDTLERVLRGPIFGRSLD